MTWLELYSFLYEKANNVKDLGKFNWQEPVLVQGVDGKIKPLDIKDSQLVFKKANTN